MKTASTLNDSVERIAHRFVIDHGTQPRVDHVPPGTGYDVDVFKYRFLSPELLANVSCMDGYTRLSAGFLSSVRGLPFIGATAARNFGPSPYFVASPDFASQELASPVVQNVKTTR